MKKTIKLGIRNAIFDNNEEYVINNTEDLELQLERRPQAKFVYFVAGDMAWKFENGKVILRHNELTDGYLYGRIEVRENGVAVRYYSVEPLKIVKLNNKIEVIPEIEVLRREVAEIKPLIEEVKRLNGVVEVLAKLTAEALNINVED